MNFKFVKSAYISMDALLLHLLFCVLRIQFMCAAFALLAYHLNYFTKKYFWRFQNVFRVGTS